MQFSVNLFDLLSLAQDFNIDAGELERNYIIEHKKYAKESDIAIIADINTAYATLKDEYRRAVYMLSLEGIDLTDEEQGRARLDQNFLLDMLAQNENLDSLTVFEELTEFLNNITLQRSEIIHNISSNFQLCNLQEIVIDTQKLRFYDNLMKMTKEKIVSCC